MKAKNILITVMLAAMALANASCEKVSPQGVLMAGTAVEDRVEMSYAYYNQYLTEIKMDVDISGDMQSEYSFLVGGDSHVTTDPGRMDEMFALGLEADDLFYAHLGDIADTKAQYYIVLDSLIREAKARYVTKNYEINEYGRFVHKKHKEDIIGWAYDEIKFPFFPVVGNHDLTHNGWALWSNIFGSSFYQFDVLVGNYGGEKGDQPVYDHFIFLDSASGTLGKKQIDLIEQGVLDGWHKYRHTFVFSHTNIFRPSSTQFASTFAREEMFYLLDQFDEWFTTAVFCGHVHAWDQREYNGVTYLTLDSMSERNSPEPGDYLVRVNVHKDGGWGWEKVHMNYTTKKKAS